MHLQFHEYDKPNLRLYNDIHLSLSVCFLMQFFVRLNYIRKCFTQKGGIFVLEEYSKFLTFFTILIDLFREKKKVPALFNFVFSLQIRKQGKSCSEDINQLWYAFYLV